MPPAVLTSAHAERGNYSCRKETLEGRILAPETFGNGNEGGIRWQLAGFGQGGMASCRKRSFANPLSY